LLPWTTAGKRRDHEGQRRSDYRSRNHRHIPGWNRFDVTLHVYLFYNYYVHSSIFVVKLGLESGAEGRIMMEEIAPNVGPRIRTLREQRGLSLRALAERCRLSINAISLIERGENSPTVSSLHMLATALGVKITDFFEDSHEHAVVYVRHERRLATQGDGLLMESLGIGLRNQQLEPFMVTMEPGVGSDGETIAHPGQEFVFCLGGTILYQVSEQTYHLEPGDSLLFEATQPHCFQNAGRSPASVLLVFQAADGSQLARRRHLEA
jgi:transcriptional regulator with XRE-family HTH domain